MKTVVIDSTPAGAPSFGWSVTPELERQHSVYLQSVDSAAAKKEALGIVQTYLTMWIVFELLTIGFLLAYLITPTFGFIEASPRLCPGMVNPINMQPQSRFSLQVYSGFSAQANGCGPDCILWTDPSAWGRFVAAAGSSNPFVSYPDTASSLSSVQALVPCGLFFLLAATAMHCYLFLKPVAHGARSAVWVYHSATWFLLLAWILVLVGQSELLYAPPMLPQLWTSFFRRGFVIADLVAPVSPSVPSLDQQVASSSCVAFLSYSGGTWLSVSVGLLFFIVWFSVIAGCCLGPLLLSASASSSV